MQMDKEQYGKAKACLISCMQEGYSWQVAKAVAGLQISQSSAYRLWRAFRQCGEVALSDGRHGHPSKLRGAARAFLEGQCQQAPHTPSSIIQVELRERFHLNVSISQINRVRAALYLSNHPPHQKQEKKRKEKKPLLKPSGKKVLAVSSCSLLFKRRSCFLTSKQSSLQTSSLLHHRSVLRTANLQHCAASS